MHCAKRGRSRHGIKSSEWIITATCGQNAEITRHENWPRQLMKLGGPLMLDALETLELVVGMAFMATVLYLASMGD